MFDSFFSLSVPTQAVVGLAMGALVILIIVGQLLDYDGSALKSKAAFFRVFSLPLLVLFGLILIIRIVMAMGS